MHSYVRELPRSVDCSRPTTTERTRPPHYRPHYRPTIVPRKHKLNILPSRTPPCCRQNTNSTSFPGPHPVAVQTVLVRPRRALSSVEEGPSCARPRTLRADGFVPRYCIYGRARWWSGAGGEPQFPLQIGPLPGSHGRQGANRAGILLLQNPDESVGGLNGRGERTFRGSTWCFVLT